VKQLLIRGRQHEGTKHVIYQVLWPKPAAGEALLVETSPRGAVSGLLQSHKGQLPLTPQLMAQPLFNSAIAIEDVAESFWQWPVQELKGVEVVSGRSCTILESHPGSGTATSYSLVRSWVSPELALPLRVEKFGKDGRLRRRFIASKIMKRPHGAPAQLLKVRAPNATSRFPPISSPRKPSADFVPHRRHINLETAPAEKVRRSADK
jgi:hypothetical protein